MLCARCRNEAVIFQTYSGRHLCARHLIMDIEARAKRSIRSHRWMRPGDHIAVILFGDRRSAALLCFLKKLTGDRRDIRLIAVPAGEGVSGQNVNAAATTIAESLGIPCTGIPGTSEDGTRAQENITRIAVARSLDDISQGIFGQFLFGDVDRLLVAHPGNVGGISVISPFMAVPGNELDLYWEIEGSGIQIPPGTPGRTNPLLQETAGLLEHYSLHHPAARYALLHLAEQLGGDIAATVPLRGSAGNGADISDGPSRQERPNS